MVVTTPPEAEGSPCGDATGGWIRWKSQIFRDGDLPFGLWGAAHGSFLSGMMQMKNWT